MATIKLQNGDSLELLKQYPDNYFDSVVTDPPYGLGFMGKEWDKPENIAFNPEFWTEVLRVLKPGGHLLAFSASRTYHRMAVAVEDAGFEIKDQIMWIYGSGFPKSQNMGKAIDKKMGLLGNIGKGIVHAGQYNGRKFDNKDNNINSKSRQASINYKEQSKEAREWTGWGSALKPAHEPIVMGRKPFKGTLTNNVLINKVGAINIEQSRIGNEKIEQGRKGRTTAESTSYHNGLKQTEQSFANGRWPSNIIYEECKEILQNFGETKKFFYGAKCSKKDRNEGLNILNNDHPTIKPTDLMMYLVRLITPNNGKVLDPFNGSGSTGKAVVLLNKTENKNYSYVGMELDPQYLKITHARMLYTMHNKTWLEKKNGK